MSDGFKCRVKGCLNPATHWQYPSMGPPRVVCDADATGRVTAFWSPDTIKPEDVAKAPKSTAPKGDLAAIRAWAKEQGYTIGDRGRIAAEIKEAYYAQRTD